jgi:hypothetical protein
MKPTTVRLRYPWSGHPAGAIVTMPSTEQANLLVRNGMAEYPNPVKSIDAPPAAKVIRSPRAKK